MACIAVEMQKLILKIACSKDEISIGLIYHDTSVSLHNTIIICHPLPSNSQQETTNSMSHVTVVAGLLLTLDHYQPQISLKLHIKYCTLDDKIVA